MVSIAAPSESVFSLVVRQYYVEQSEMIVLNGKQSAIVVAN